MLKRQDTLLSSSSRRETVPENHHAKAIGCMAGIFQLISRYQHRRKFLTFGRKHEKSTVPSPTKAKPLVQGNNKKQEDQICDIRRFSCDVHRSPTLPAEIRRSNSVHSPENFRTPPALVARLMGLEETPSVVEKRRKLLGALEKCDEDLKALKKIIEAVRSAEQLRSPPVVKRVNVECGASPWSTVKKCMGGDDKIRTTSGGRQYVSGEAGDRGIINKVKKCSDFNSEQPSPVSVLDEFTPSPLCSYSKRHTNGRVAQQRKKPGEEDIINVSLFNKVTTESFQAKCETEAWPLWSSKAMIESVDEVCRDIAWGEKREAGRIGLVLQDYICRDLIEEIVKELGCCCMYPLPLPLPLPLEPCKRRLCF